MTDWTQLGTPLIIALIPVLVALTKTWIPENAKRYYPLLATILGPALDYVRALATARQADPLWGVAYGLAAIGARELYDQWFGVAARQARLAAARKLCVAALALVVFAGCAATTTQTGLATSGESLITLSNQFVTVGALYTGNCTPQVKSPSFTGFCDGFKAFAPKFQQDYPLAAQAWKAAREANDASKTAGAQATIAALAASLTQLAIAAVLAAGGQ